LYPKVSADVIKTRTKKLVKIGKDLSDNVLKSFVGKTVNFLVEKRQKSLVFGKTDHFLQIILRDHSESLTIGNVSRAVVYSVENNHLIC
jgi:tRNA A37 methylthiotransferase MiaB